MKCYQMEEHVSKYCSHSPEMLRWCLPPHQHGSFLVQMKVLYEQSIPTQQKRTCNTARLCKNLACKTCMACARDMSLFLHNSCTILHLFLQNLASNVQETPNLQVIILAASLAPFLARYVQDLARYVQESCKKGTHVPCKSCMQDSCTILHDLASSFLLGSFTHSQGN